MINYFFHLKFNFCTVRSYHFTYLIDFFIKNVVKKLHRKCDQIMTLDKN